MDEFTDGDLAKMMRALHMVVLYHGEQVRRTGEPYWEHCLSVATAVWEAGFGIDGIIAALLHDIIEDCDPDLVDKVKADIVKYFGGRVLAIVVYLTKYDKATYMDQVVEGAALYCEVPGIKIADRDCNLLTVTMLNDDFAWQLKYIQETLNELIPTFERCVPLVPKQFVQWYTEMLDKMRVDALHALYTVNCYHRPRQVGAASP